MITVAKKGYTLKVVSWENDGDNYKTITHHVVDREEAIALAKMCTILFKSINRSGTGIGNTCIGNYKYFEKCDTSESDKISERILKYAKENPLLFETIDIENEDELNDFISDIAYTLLGNSEYYNFRVCESVCIYYSPENIELEKIEF